MGDIKNRRIDCFDDTVFLWINNRLPTYTDRADIMGPILEMPLWTWHWRADGRLGAVTNKEGKDAGITTDPYLYQLRWAAEYYGARATSASIAEALRRMREDFSAQKLNIDHIDNNFRNCCLWNLASMTRSQNALKKNLTAKIFQPFFWFSVNTGSGYRVFYGDDMDNPHKIHCETSKEYISVLKRFYEVGVGSSCPPKEISDGQRIGYDSNHNLTATGEQIIQYLRTAPDAYFNYSESFVGK